MAPQLGFAPLTREPGVGVKLASAGTAACLAEALTFPLDVAKVRLMVQGEGATRRTKMKYQGVFGTMRTVARTEGPRALYSGLVAGFHRQLALGTVRIGFYDSAKRFYGGILDTPGSTEASIPARICAGVTTGIMAVGVGQPTDVVKVRMQAQGSTGVVRYTGALNAYTTIATNEGITGLWRGFMPNAMRTAVVNACEIVSYDVIKSSLVRHQLLSDNAPCHMTAAVGAALVTIIVSSPIDVVKTRYMNAAPGLYNSIAECSRAVWAEKRLAGFYKGCVPSFYRICSWNVVMFISYEQLKRAMSHRLDVFQSPLTADNQSD